MSSSMNLSILDIPGSTSFGSQRVINGDRVEAHTGFGTHSHREFEIFSYLVSGEIEQCVSFPSLVYIRQLLN